MSAGLVLVVGTLLFLFPVESPSLPWLCEQGLSVLLRGKSAIFTLLVEVGCWEEEESQIKGTSPSCLC